MSSHFKPFQVQFKQSFQAMSSQDPRAPIKKKKKKSGCLKKRSGNLKKPIRSHKREKKTIRPPNNDKNVRLGLVRSFHAKQKKPSPCKTVSPQRKTKCQAIYNFKCSPLPPKKCQAAQTKKSSFYPQKISSQTPPPPKKVRLPQKNYLFEPNIVYCWNLHTLKYVHVLRSRCECKIIKPYTVIKNQRVLCWWCRRQLSLDS